MKLQLPEFIELAEIYTRNISGLYARKCHRNHGCTRMQYRRTNIARSDLFLVVLFLKKPNLMHQPSHYNGAIINPTGALATQPPSNPRTQPERHMSSDGTFKRLNVTVYV